MSKFTVDFPSQVNKVLEDLADEKGTSKVEILRRAIATYKVLSDKVDQGGSVRIIADNKETELVLP